MSGGWSFGGGGSFGGGWGVPSGGAVRGIVVAPRKKKHHGVGGFFANLGGDIAGLRSLPAGLLHMGGAVLHDFTDPAFLGGNAFSRETYTHSHVAPIATQIYHSYTDPRTFWGELGRGHPLGSAKAFYEHPLGPALDVATLFTGGGASAAKLGKLAAEGRLGAVAARSGGLARVAGYVPRTVPAELRAVAAGIPETRFAEHFVPGTRMIRVSKDGIATRPVFRPVVANPAIRLRQGQTAAALDRLPGATPIVGAERRFGRALKQTLRQQTDKRRMVVLGTAKQAVDRLPKHEQKAWYALHQGLSGDEYVRLLGAGLKDAQAEGAAAGLKAAAMRDARPKIKVASSTEKGARRQAALREEDALTIRKRLKEFSPRVVQAANEPSERLLSAVAQTHAVSDEMQAVLDKAGMLPRERSAARALLPQELLAGKRWMERNPTKLVPTKAAESAAERLATMRGAREAEAAALERHAKTIREVLPPAEHMVTVRKRARLERPMTVKEAQATSARAEAVIRGVLHGRKTRLLDELNPTKGHGRFKGPDARQRAMAGHQGEKGAVPGEIERANRGAPAKGVKRKGTTGREYAAMYLQELLDAHAAGRPISEEMRRQMPPGMADHFDVHANREELFNAHGIQHADVKRLVAAQQRHRELSDILKEHLDPERDPAHFMYDESLPAARALPMKQMRGKGPVVAERVSRRTPGMVGHIRMMERRALSLENRAARLRGKVPKPHRELEAAAAAVEHPHEPGFYQAQADLLERDLVAAGYMPSGGPSSKPRFFGGGTRRGPVVNKPRADFKRATGVNIMRARDVADPQAFFDQAQRVLRLADAHSRYRTLLAYSPKVAATEVPTEGKLSDRLRGSEPFVILNEDRIRNLEATRVRVAAFAGDLEKLVGDNFEASQQIAKYREALQQQLPSDGMVHAVPRALHEAVTADLRGMTRMEKVLLDSPLQFFRTMVLKLRPAWLVGNVVGNHLMLAMRDPTPAMLATYVDTLLGVKGVPFVTTFVNKVARTPEYRQSWLNALQHVRSATEQAGLVPTEAGSLSRSVGNVAKDVDRKAMTRAFAQTLHHVAKAPDAAAQLSAYLSDDIVRTVRVRRILEPDIARARRAKPQVYRGMDDAAVAEKLMADNPRFAERVERQALDDLIDYRDLSPFEQRWIRRIIPFYTWLKGISTWTAREAINRPGRWDLAMNQARVAQEQQIKEFGGDPGDYLMNSMFLGGPQAGTGRRRALLTATLNPWATIPDVAAMIAGTVTGHPGQVFGTGTLASAMSPVIQSAVEGVTGTDLFTGRPVKMPFTGSYSNRTHAFVPAAAPPGGSVGAALSQFFGNLPQSQLAQRAYFGGAGPTSPYAGTGWESYLARYMGVPVATIDPRAALALQQKTLKQRSRAGGGGYGAGR